MKIRTLATVVALGASLVAGGGCLIDDTGAPQSGSQQGPRASLPDSGAPNRRESAAKTIRDADPNQPADADLQVAPPPAR